MIQSLVPQNSGDRARAAYLACFGNEPALITQAPGRVNLIGEHTDYNEGYVLPMQLGLTCSVAASPAASWNLTAADLGESWTPDSEPFTPGSWTSYVMGVIHTIGDLLARQGAQCPPLNMVIASDVPIGSGLSSSAALEVAVARAVIGLAAPSPTDIDPVVIAKVCQQAEHTYAKVPCGIMDQLIVTAGRPGTAMLLDCRSLKRMLIPLPDSRRAVFVVMETGVRHKLAASSYASRRASCESAAHKLGLAALRDADGYMLEHARPDLTQAEFDAATHVVGENTRVLVAADALRAGDLERVGQLMNQSHISLRDLFQVSCDELDAMVDIARATNGVLGARMTGAGFGGCAVALIRADRAEQAIPAIAAEYERRAGRPCGRIFTA